jgi:hypothetical protein
MLYAGLDLSRQRLDVHVLDEEGRTVEVTAVHPDADALRTLAHRVLRQRTWLNLHSSPSQTAAGALFADCAFLSFFLAITFSSMRRSVWHARARRPSLSVGVLSVAPSA